MLCGRSSVAVPLASPPFSDDAADRVPADDAAEGERVDVAFFGADRERPAPADAREPVDRLDDDDPPDLEAELLVVLLPVLRLELFFFPVLLFAELFLLVLFLPVLRLELLLAVLLLEVLFAVLLFAVALLELLLAGLFLLVLFLLVLRLELLFAGLFLPVLLELLFAVFLLELLFAVLLVPVLLLLAPERFFAPLRFREEPPRPPFDSASMSSSFRIREAPAIPARVARLRSSATVMSSMLRATSAPSPIVPLTCAVATPVRRPLITPPSAAPPGARGRGFAPCSPSPPSSRGAGYTGREPGVAATGTPPMAGVDGSEAGVLAVAHAGTNRPWPMEHLIEKSWPRRSGGRAPIQAILSRARPRSRALDCSRMPPRTGSAPRACVAMRSVGSRTSTSRSISVRTPTSSSAGPAIDPAPEPGPDVITAGPCRRFPGRGYATEPEVLSRSACAERMRSMMPVVDRSETKESTRTSPPSSRTTGASGSPSGE
jgi:hypothetical protein